MSTPTFPILLERFFTQRLMQQREASAHTIASYRDTFRLLLKFVQKRLRKAPSTLSLEDIDASIVVDFLDELEKVRKVTPQNPQPSPDRHPLVLPIRGVRSPCPRSADPARARCPAQAICPEAGAVPHPTRSRCTTRGARSANLVGAARSRAHPARRTDWATACGADGPSSPGSASGDRRACPCDR